MTKHLDKGKAGCVFCRKLEDGSEIIYSNGIFAAQFDRFPVAPGHAELFPVSHTESIGDMDELQRSCLFVTLGDLVEIINSTDLEELYHNMAENPLDGISKAMCEYMLSKPYLKEPFVDYNLGCNNGRLAGRTVDHLHFHIIPRHSGDVADPVGGVRHTIPGMGNYRNWKMTE